MTRSGQVCWATGAGDTTPHLSTGTSCGQQSAWGPSRGLPLWPPQTVLLGWRELALMPPQTGRTRGAGGRVGTDARGGLGAAREVGSGAFPWRPDCFVLPGSVGIPSGPALASQCAWERGPVPGASAQGLASSLACSLVADSRGREGRLSGILLSVFTSLAATQNICGDLQMPSAQRKPVPKAAPVSRRPHGE